MSHATCCWAVWLGRCDRCDLLVGLEGFHLVAAARRECAMVLDIESCDRCAGCPGCGVTCSRSRACGGGGDRRALGPGFQCGSGGTTALGVPRTHLPDGHSWAAARRCVLPGRVGVRVIRWAIQQLHVEGATIAGLGR